MTSPATTAPRSAVKRRERLDPWVRPRIRPGLVLQDRDRTLLRHVLDFRYLDFELAHHLLGARGDPRPESAISQRLVKLWRAGFLTRPKSARFLGRPAIYCLGPLGAAEVADSFSDGRDYRRFAEKEGGAAHLAHELAVALTMSTYLRGAAWIKAHTPGFERLTFDWIPYPRRREATLRISDRLPSGTECQTAVRPDGYFTLRLPGTLAIFCVEVDRSRDRRTMEERYRIYREWWRINSSELRSDAASQSDPRDISYRFRVVTITYPERLSLLRAAAASATIDEAHREPWAGLLFATFADVNPMSPQTSFSSIYRLPEGDRRLGLL